MDAYSIHTALGMREESIATRAATMLAARGARLTHGEIAELTVAAQLSSPKPKELNSTPGAQACSSKNSQPHRS